MDLVGRLADINFEDSDLGARSSLMESFVVPDEAAVVEGGMDPARSLTRKEGDSELWPDWCCY